MVPKTVDSNGDDNIHNVQNTCLERAFIAKEYPVGSSDDPFDRIKIESQIASIINQVKGIRICVGQHHSFIAC